MKTSDLFELKLKRCSSTGRELAYSLSWMQLEDIDANWVRELKDNPLLNERVSAFVFRFTKFQDYYFSKLVPVFIEMAAEVPGRSVLENLAVLERSGIIDSSERVLEIREYRNSLTHEYEDDAQKFSEILHEIVSASEMMLGYFNNILAFCEKNMKIPDVWQYKLDFNELASRCESCHSSPCICPGGMKG